MSQILKSSTATIDFDYSDAEFEKALALEEQKQILTKGTKISGVVVKVTDSEIFININYKAEGRIPRSEFGNNPPSQGDSIEVIFKGEDSEGNVNVSFAELQRAEIEANLEEGKVLKARIIKLLTRKKDDEEQAIPVGFQAELAPGFTAFIPLSQIDLHPAPPESYIDSVMQFYIERIETKGRHQNIVLNRRKLLEQELQNKRKEFFDTYKIGDVVKGQVRSFVEFGAFIDLGGFSGLLHIINMAWYPVKKPQDLIKLGDILELKILDMDLEKKKIGLSLKAMQVNPWDTIQDKYSVGQIVEGKVTRLQTYGAFAELEPGIEGLIHVSEMSWIKQIKYPKEVLDTGDQVKVQILELDTEAQRMRLGLRQTMPNPWDSIQERYPVGTRLTLKVKNIIKNGAFFILEEGIDAFLHQDDLSWAKRRSVNDVAKVDQSLEVQIISIDAKDQRIRLGLKQLEENPWQELKKLKKKTVIEGSVVNKADFGIFVSIGGIEGLIHKNDLTNDQTVDRDELLKNYNNGDKIRALIIEIDEKKRRLGLSIKALERNEEQQSISQYLLKNDDIDSASFTLGDALKNK